ncbi:MAG: polyribonucleotide nucleotidyltransferase, partial [Atopobiaceae bacterium]|nr:polyribonucleotide nucleotidyltransferase [Atopobiaceae bacterium]
MAKVSHEFDLYGKHYVLEAGELAKQATGACLVKCGDSTVLLTVVVSKERRDYDFFPLTVDYNEKMYAVGRIPGGYLKREARPSEKATLTARMIDRPRRPSFPDGFRNEVQVVATSLVADQVNSVDTICIMGASAALTVGGVPFEGPLACVRIGRDRDTGEFIVNPTYEERDNSDLDLELAGSATFISMLEAGAEEISEEDMLAAMAFGQEAIAAFCEEQKKFFAKWVEVNGEIAQREYILDEPIPEVHERVFAHYDEMSATLKDADKASRVANVEALKDRIKAEFTAEEQEEYSRALAVELKGLEKHAMRMMVVETGERVDGRVADEVRPLMVKPDYLPLVHGSGLFQRGQTQVLSVATLGMLNEWQRLDTIEPVDGKRYIHHYNFPPFCTGETGRIGSPKRRELGHGALAERALLPVIPSEEEFPYTIRVVSEVMESNGSSSMASTCGSTLALMDAGVPIKRPVSGVAMGLIQEAGKTVVLTDIQGLEDFLGDMDFKVCGTTKGITAMQMDNKATGLTPDILRNALMQAHEGRMFILDAMLEQIPAPREATKNTAPQIITITIPTDKIREVIGSGGKVIRGIQDDTGATVDIQEDGTIFIAGTNGAGEAAAERIKAIVKVPEVGEEYTGRVVGIQA